MHPAKTILLIHGLWVTPLCWENFARRFRERGYNVLAPAWPGAEGTPSALRDHPASLRGIGIREVIAHYTAIIDRLPEPPVIMGHSYGGLITQLLINLGYGAAGVAIDSVPPKGVLILPLSTYRSLLPAFLRPGTFKGTFLFTFKQFWRVFANTLPEAEARAAYEQVIPAPGRAIFQAALSNLTPRSPATINFRQPDRAPLLFIAGEKDVIMPAALNRKNFNKYRAGSAPVDFRVFPGRSHYIIAEPGWEEVADYALQWAESRTGLAS